MATTTPADTIRVSVAGKIHTYPAMLAELGDHLAAAAGLLPGLPTAVESARATVKAMNDGGFPALAAQIWCWLDDSGLAYLLDVRASGAYAIIGAAPLPGPGNVREIYTA